MIHLKRKKKGLYTNNTSLLIYLFPLRLFVGYIQLLIVLFFFFFFLLFCNGQLSVCLLHIFSGKVSESLFWQLKTVVGTYAPIDWKGPHIGKRREKKIGWRLWKSFLLYCFFFSRSSSTDTLKLTKKTYSRAVLWVNIFF